MYILRFMKFLHKVNVDIWTSVGTECKTLISSEVSLKKIWPFSFLHYFCLKKKIHLQSNWTVKLSGFPA